MDQKIMIFIVVSEIYPRMLKTYGGVTQTSQQAIPKFIAGLQGKSLQSMQVKEARKCDSKLWDKVKEQLFLCARHVHI